MATRSADEILQTLRPRQSQTTIDGDPSDKKDHIEEQESSATEEECNEFSTSEESDEEEAPPEQEAPSTSGGRRESFVYGKNKWSLNARETRGRRMIDRTHLPGPIREARNIRNP